MPSTLPPPSSSCRSCVVVCPQRSAASAVGETVLASSPRALVGVIWSALALATRFAGTKVLLSFSLTSFRLAPLIVAFIVTTIIIIISDGGSGSSRRSVAPAPPSPCRLVVRDRLLRSCSPHGDRSWRRAKRRRHSSSDSNGSSFSNRQRRCQLARWMMELTQRRVCLSG